jgi:hypothetical protein
VDSCLIQNQQSWRAVEVASYTPYAAHRLDFVLGGGILAIDYLRDYWLLKDSASCVRIALKTRNRKLPGKKHDTVALYNSDIYDMKCI